MIRNQPLPFPAKLIAIESTPARGEVEIVASDGSRRIETIDYFATTFTFQSTVNPGPLHSVGVASH